MRDVGQRVVQVPGLVAHLPDLARRVGAFERCQIDHAQRQLQGMNLGVFLDAAFLEPIDPLFDADLVDCRRLRKVREAAGECVPCNHGVLGCRSEFSMKLH